MKFLSIVALNSLVSLRIGVLISLMFPMLLSQSKYGGAQVGGLGKAELFTLPPSTPLVPLVTWVEPSTPALMIL